MSIQKAIEHLPMSSSTNKKPLTCSFCGKVKERIQKFVPLLGKRWVTVACECELKDLENQKLEQEQKRKKERIIHALKLSSSLDDIQKFSFENFRMRPGTEAAFDEIQDAVLKFEERGSLGVMLFGISGNGKSHLTAAGGNELIKRGYSVIFLTEKDLLSRLNSTRNFRNEESFAEIMNACIQADLLVWDDLLSSQRLSLDEKDWIFQIVNGRERAGKPIWATTNLSESQFDNPQTAYLLDDKGRTWWRLIGNMNCVCNRATNHRKLQAIARMKGISPEMLDQQLRGA